MAGGRKRVETVPADWLDAVRPRVEAGRHFKEAAADSESLHIIGIQFKELSNQSLRNFGWCQIHSIQRTKQRQQIEPRRFQTGAEIGGNFHRAASEHDPSMAHRETEVNGWRVIFRMKLG